MTFADVLEIKNGRNQRAVEDPTGPYPIYGSGGIMGYANDYICDAETVIIGRKGNINKPIFVEEPFWNVDTAFGLAAKRDILLPKYLYYFCLRYDFEQHNKTVTIPSLTKADLLKIQINLPNIDDQQRIVRELHKLEGILSLRQQQLSSLDDLIKARFVEMFGDEKNLMTMNDVCSIITDGTHQPPKFIDDGIPFIFVSNITGNKVTYDAEKYIDQDTYDELIKRTPIEIGDILLSTVGSYGHPAVVKTNKKFLFQRHIAYLKPKKELIDSDYLHGAILSPDAQRQIEEGVKGIAQKTLNLSEIKKMRIPVPNLDRQKEFSAFVAQIDKSKFIVIKRSDKVINEQLQQEFRDLDHLIELAVNQSPFTEYSDKEFIFAAIISFVDEIRKSIAAINAYGIIECKLVPVPPEQVELWELNIESVWRRLISDLSKLFDRAETCGKSNCSLQQHKEFCLRPENRALFPEQETDPLITAIGSLYQQYEDVISRSTRNEQVAHHDLKALRSNPPGFISLKALNELVEDTTKVVSEIGSKLFPFDVSFPSIEDYQHYYKAAIMSMLGHNEIT